MVRDQFNKKAKKKKKLRKIIPRTLTADDIAAVNVYAVLNFFFFLLLISAHLPPIKMSFNYFIWVLNAKYYAVAYLWSRGPLSSLL